MEVDGEVVSLTEGGRTRDFLSKPFVDRSDLVCRHTRSMVKLNLFISETSRGSPPTFRDGFLVSQERNCFDQIFITKSELVRETEE